MQDDRGIRWFLRRLLHWLAPYRAGAALMLAALLVDLAYESLLPLAFKFLIDDAIVPRNSGWLLAIGTAMAALCIASAASATGRDYLYAWLSAHVLADLRLEMYRHLQRLSMNFYSRNQVGDIMSRFSSDLAAVENALVLALPAGAYSALGVVASAAILFALEWRIAPLAAVGIPLCLIGPRLIGPPRPAPELRVEEPAGGDLEHDPRECLGAGSGKGFRLAARGVRPLPEPDDGFPAALAARQLSHLPDGAHAQSRADGVQSRGDTGGRVDGLRGASCDRVAGRVPGPVSQPVPVRLRSVYGLTWVVPHFVRATAGMQRIDELLAQQPDIFDAPDAVPLPEAGGTVAFRDVSFSYGAGKSGLDRASFEIASGTYAVFVGTSGSGKSTILNLLLRFYDPGRGSVTIGGRDLRGVTQASLRERTGVVLQESFLFNATVRENLLLAKPDAHEDELVAAARAAVVHDAILDLPQGGTTPRSASAAGGCPGASGSASPSRARCCATRCLSFWTRRLRRSIRRPSQR